MVVLLNNTIPAVDSVEEIDVDDNDIEATNKKDEDEEDDDEDEAGEDLVVEKKIEMTFKVDRKLPMMVRMANLCVVGGFSVNGVAEIHSEIVKEEVFNEFYEVLKTADSFFVNMNNYLLELLGIHIHKIRYSLNFSVIDMTVVA